MEGLKEYYNFKSTTVPEYHLGVDYISKLDSKGRRMYQLGSKTYAKEAIQKMKNLSAELGRKPSTLRSSKCVMIGDRI